MNFSEELPANFRSLIAFSVLAQRPIRIPAPSSLPASCLVYLDLVSQICPSSTLRPVDSKSYLFSPSLPTNNQGLSFSFDCGSARAIGYYIEPIILISMFGPDSLHLNLQGVTNDDIDNGPEALISAAIPLLEQFGVKGLSINVKKRAFRPDESGEVSLVVPVVKKLTRVKLTELLPWKRIRGTCFGGKIGGQWLNRVVDSAKGIVMKGLMPDVWIHTDLGKGCKGSGLGVMLCAETKTGRVAFSEKCIDESTVKESKRKSEHLYFFFQTLKFLWLIWDLNG